MAFLDLKYALSSCRGQLLESGVRSKKANTDRAVDPELKNREISFLTRILGRMTLICIFPQIMFLWDLRRVHTTFKRLFRYWLELSQALWPRLSQGDVQYILLGAVGLPWGSYLYVWNPHIICGRTGMCNGHQYSVRGVTRVPGVDGAVALRDGSRELSYRPGGLL